MMHSLKMFRVFSLLIDLFALFFWKIERDDTTVTNTIKLETCLERERERDSLAFFDGRPIYKGSAIIERRRKDKSLRHGRLLR